MLLRSVKQQSKCSPLPRVLGPFNAKSLRGYRGDAPERRETGAEIRRVLCGGVPIRLCGSARGPPRASQLRKLLVPGG